TGKYEPDGMKRRGKVDRQGTLPILGGQLLYMREIARHGIVHQYVDGAGPRDRRLDHACYALGRGKVRLHVMRGDTEAGGKVLRDPLALFLSHQTMEDNIVARACERLGGGKPKPRGRAGNERCFP